MSDRQAVAAPRHTEKSPSAFRTIGEVAADLDLPAHVLRFWESKFPQVRPLKRGGGRRYYRPEDVALLRRIRNCLYRDGYTIRGVQKLLREAGRPGGPATETPAMTPPGLFAFAADDPPRGADLPRRAGRRSRSPEPLRETLEALRGELREIRALIDALPGRRAPPD